MRALSAILFLAGLLFFANAYGAEQIDAARWRSVQTYDVSALKSIAEMKIQKVVGIRFTFRGKRVRHVKPNWYEASLWQVNPQEKSGFSYLRVLVAKNDLAAFQELPTDFNAPEKNLLYGRVLKDFDAHYLFIQALGRRATIDGAGRATFAW